jgi:beta-lactamase regulating signal transducer with metallopeptidase domain
MMSSIFVATLFAASASALARVTALYRGPSLRWIWAAAAVASSSSALLLLRPSPPSVTAVFERLAATSTAQVPEPARVQQIAQPARAIPRLAMPGVPPSVDGVLRIGWGVASATLLAVLLITSVRLVAERRSWTRARVADTPVMISTSFGPAIVGVLNPSIVLPEWVLELDETSQRLIVAHEAEHRAARDPALILAGLAMVVLMPWNIGLWLTWRGLRRAVELDCDARVIASGADDSEYANVLLGAWRTAQASWLPSTAFAERASGLGARVEHLMRPTPRRRAMRTVAGALVTSALVLVACMTPSPQHSASSASGPYPLVIIDGVRRPDLPPRFRFTGPVVVETTTTPTFRIVYKGNRVEDTTMRALYPSMADGTIIQTIDAPASVKHFGEDAKYGAVLYYTKKYRDAGGMMTAPTEGNIAVRAADPATTAAEMARRVYDRLFQGTTLPPDRASRALQIVEAEGDAQRTVGGPVMVSWNTRIDLNAKRDAELRALLATDAERERFDARSVEGRPRPVTIEMVAQGMFNNLFRNPATPADVRNRALAIITASLNDDAAAYRRNPDALDERLAIRARRDSSLRALQVTDEDRALFDKIAPRTRDGEIKR